MTDQPSTPAYSSEPPPQGGVTQDDKLFALLAYLLSLVIAIVAPLVIYLVKKDQSRFVAFHAMQSLFMDAAVVVLSVAVYIIAFVLGMTPIGCFAAFLYFIPMIAGLAWLILKVIAAIKAYNGERYLVPIIGGMVQKQIPV